MTERGYTRQLSDPDMMINYQVAIDREVDETAMEDAAYGRSMNMPELSWENGSLVVILFDATSGSALWGGRATASVEPKLNKGQRHNKLKRIVSTLFKDFTPTTNTK